MQRAMDESNRRREVQLAYNEEHNVTPIGVSKRILDVMEGAYANPTTRERTKGRGVAEKAGAYAQLDFGDPKAVAKEISKLEAQMYEHAKNLAFEDAARTRDKIGELRSRLIA
jgi:excinuclease ABC subunit B